MFRYICIVVLLGGKSVRMGFCKSFFLLDGVSFLDRVLYLCFDVGFISILIGGYSVSYSYVMDIVENIGSIASFLSVFYNKRFFFGKFFFISVDIPFLNIRNILNCVFNLYDVQSLYNEFFLFPLVLCLSESVCFFLNRFLSKKTKILYSVFYFLYFVFEKKKFFIFFDKKFLININRMLDFLFLK